MRARNVMTEKGWRFRLSGRILCVVNDIMVFKKTSEVKADEFWGWFLKNNHKFLFLGDVSEEEKDTIMDDLLEHLHTYCERLFFSVRHRQDHEMELVISADGVAEYFDDVEALVDAAPDIPRWQIVKFRQPHAPGFSIAYADKDYYPEDIIFLPLYNEESPDAVAIRVCYPDYIEAERAHFVNLSFLLLDSLIGEKSAALDIDYLDVSTMPAGEETINYPHLASISQYIREKKIFKYPGEKFSVVEYTDADGYSAFITANVAYRHFRYRESFPWCLSVRVNIHDYNENGYPVEGEAEVLNAFEDMLDGHLKSGCIAHYIGRITFYKRREIIYYVDDAAKAELFLANASQSPEVIRNFQFSLEKDDAWQKVAFIWEMLEDPA